MPACKVKRIGTDSIVGQTHAHTRYSAFFGLRSFFGESKVLGRGSCEKKTHFFRLT